MKPDTLELVRDVAALMRAHARRDFDTFDDVLDPYYRDPERAGYLVRALAAIAWTNLHWYAEETDQEPEALLEEIVLDYATEDSDED